MGNKKTLESKMSVVSEITNRVKSSSSVVFFDYRGLSDEEITELRKKLRESDSDMKVYKNTLTKRALDDLNLTIEECVVGPSAVVFGTDAIAPIKTLVNYAKDHILLSIKGGIVDGKVSSMESLAKLATIPSREGLLTMLAGGLIGIPRDLCISLNLYAEQKN